MKCNDCGSADFTSSLRADVCLECFDLRGKLLDAVKSGSVSMDEFRELQHEISTGRGLAANAIRRVLGLSSPDL
jgi:hypothetical protein